MTQLSYSVPDTGDPFATAAAQVDTALTQIYTTVNGSLDTGNLADDAGILGSQLADDAGIEPTQIDGLLIGAVTQPDITSGVARQPSTTRPTLVSVTCAGSGGVSASASIGDTDDPGTLVGAAVSESTVARVALTFLVPAGYYYIVVAVDVTMGCTEWTL